MDFWGVHVWHIAQQTPGSQQPLMLITGNGCWGKKHEKGGLSWWTKATEDTKNSLLSPFHCLPGKLCHELLAGCQSMLHTWSPGCAVSLGLCIQPEPRSCTLSLCFQPERANCALLAWTARGAARGLQFSQPRTVKDAIFTRKGTRIINFLSVWFTWRHVKDFCFPIFFLFCWIWKHIYVFHQLVSFLGYV